MEGKVCFKCPENGVQPYSNFYKHPKMPDGYLGKCKECAKKDVKENYAIKTNDPYYIEKERTRGRRKHHRLYSGKSKHNEKTNRDWQIKYPEKFAAHKYNTNKLVPKGFEGHHWSYNDEHVKDVIPFTKKHHMKGHRFLVYDQERKMYRRYDTNELLDTKEKHQSFIEWCIVNKED